MADFTEVIVEGGVVTYAGYQSNHLMRVSQSEPLLRGRSPLAGSFQQANQQAVVRALRDKIQTGFYEGSLNRDRLRETFTESYQRALSSYELYVRNAYVRGYQDAVAQMGSNGRAVDPLRVIERATRSGETQSNQGRRALLRSYDLAYRDVLGVLSSNRNDADRLMAVDRRLMADDFVRGRACLSRGIHRVDRTEYQRAYHRGLMTTYQEGGVEYCRWLLSGDHPDYGGTEVCEVYASGTGASAEYSSISDKVGLYAISEAPMVPHPNCRCTLEAVFANR